MKKINIFITDSDYSCNDTSFAYLLGFQPSKWVMLLSDDSLDVILDSRYFAKTKSIDINKIKQIIWNESLKINFHEESNPIKAIIGFVNNKNDIDKLVFEWKIAWEYIEDIVKNTKQNYEILKWAYFSEKRVQKMEFEKDNIIKAIKIIDKVFNYILELNKQNKLIWKTEKELRWIIISKIFEFWWEWESFDSIVAFGDNSAIPHHKSSDKKIWNGVLLIDMWAKYNMYCSDFTRTFWVGEKTDLYDEFVKVYNIVKSAHLNAFENAKIWMEWKEIDSLARDYISQTVYKDRFIHGTGHWLGLDIHEIPFINPNWDIKIKENMFFTIEPWIYLEWKFWVRLEDIVYVTKNWLVKFTEVDL